MKEKINKLGQRFFIRSAFSWSRKQDESGFPKWGFTLAPAPFWIVEAFGANSFAHVLPHKLG